MTVTVVLLVLSILFSQQTGNVCSWGGAQVGPITNLKHAEAMLGRKHEKKLGLVLLSYVFKVVF